jgi:DNA-binding transcriptional ArsR family regulator
VLARTVVRRRETRACHRARRFDPPYHLWDPDTKCLMGKRTFSIIENMELTFHAFRQLTHPEKAEILVHLARHGGDTPEDISQHLERPISSVYRYLADLESARLVVAREGEGVRHYHPVRFHITLNPETLEGMLRTPVDVITAYRASLGKRRWDRVAEALDRARRGESTLRQAARRSGLPYREFVSVYQSLKPPVAEPEGRSRRQFHPDRRGSKGQDWRSEGACDVHPSCRQEGDR